MKQGIQNVCRLIGPAGDEAAKQRNVIVRNVSIGDTTGFVVTDVMFSKQVVFLRFEMGAIGCRGLALSPLLWQLKFGIQVDQVRRGGS